MNYNLQFDKLCQQLNIGSLIAEPLPLTGGHMHKMFVLNTTTRKYAVKALNPGVMQRPEAMGNLINAENIAQIAAQSIPAIPALVFNNTFIQELDGQYYFIFDFVDGKTLSNNELTVQHSEIIGKLLAKLHKIDFSKLNLIDDYSYTEDTYDWSYYLHKGIESKAVWVELVNDNIVKLYDWMRILNKAAAELSVGTVISHGDLEPKNVMWQNEKPIIIDWEAAAFVHPAFDLFETAFYWAKDDNNIQKDRFIAFMRAYKEVNLAYIVNINAVLDKGYCRLGWLNYSFMRSLGIECADDAEKQLGTDHVIWSINDLLQYEKMIPLLKEWMQEAVNL
jgi:aminoglycoside phosphotransferase (APT) family kinase protein